MSTILARAVGKHDNKVFAAEFKVQMIICAPLYLLGKD